MTTSDAMPTVEKDASPGPAVPAPAQSGWLVVLDALRGGAALYVVCNHASLLLLIGFKQAQSLEMPLAVKAMAACSYLFAFGHQAVVLFFVLSGFVIHLRQAQKMDESSRTGASFQFKVKPYLIRRLRRIVPPFYFALLLTAVLDFAVRTINPAFAAPATGNPLVDNILVQHNDWQTLAGNLVFLQWLHFATWGNDTPVWSLAYEFYLYLLYPVFWRLRLREGVTSSVGTVLMVSLASMVLLALFPTQVWFLPVFAYWFCWVLGAWGAEMYVTGAPLRGGTHPTVVAVLAALWLGTSRMLPGPVSDTLGAVACVLFLLLTIRIFESRMEQKRLHRGLGFFSRVGKFSYSLYLTHVPVLALLWAIWYQKYAAMPTNPLLIAVGIGCALGVGWASYWLVERRFSSRAS